MAGVLLKRLKASELADGIALGRRMLPCPKKASQSKDGNEGLQVRQGREEIGKQNVEARV
jgi:hypothetical protein